MKLIFRIRKWKSDAQYIFDERVNEVQVVDFCFMYHIFLKNLFFNLFSLTVLLQASLGISCVHGNRARGQSSIREILIFFKISPETLVYFTWFKLNLHCRNYLTWVNLKMNPFAQGEGLLKMDIAGSNHLRGWRIIILTFQFCFSRLVLKKKKSLLVYRWRKFALT